MKSRALEALQPIAQDIWDMKYRLRDAAGAPIDGVPASLTSPRRICTICLVGNEHGAA